MGGSGLYQWEERMFAVWENRDCNCWKGGTGWMGLIIAGKGRKGLVVGIKRDW